MKQHETTEQKQEQASRIGWTEGQPRNFTQFSMEISRARNKLHNDIYDSEDKGGLGFSSPYFISRLQVLEEIYQMLQEVEREEAPTLAPCGCETRSRTDLSVGWHRCGMEDD